MSTMGPARSRFGDDIKYSESRPFDMIADAANAKQFLLCFKAKLDDSLLATSADIQTPSMGESKLDRQFEKKMAGIPYVQEDLDDPITDVLPVPNPPALTMGETMRISGYKKEKKQETNEQAKIMSIWNAMTTIATRASLASILEDQTMPFKAKLRALETRVLAKFRAKAADITTALELRKNKMQPVYGWDDFEASWRELETTMANLVRLNDGDDFGNTERDFVYKMRSLCAGDKYLLGLNQFRKWIKDRVVITKEAFHDAISECFIRDEVLYDSSYKVVSAQSSAFSAKFNDWSTELLGSAPFDGSSNSPFMALAAANVGSNYNGGGYRGSYYQQQGQANQIFSLSDIKSQADLDKMLREHTSSKIRESHDRRDKRELEGNASQRSNGSGRSGRSARSGSVYSRGGGGNNGGRGGQGGRGGRRYWRNRDGRTIVQDASAPVTSLATAPALPTTHDGGKHANKYQRV